MLKDKSTFSPTNLNGNSWNDNTGSPVTPGWNLGKNNLNQHDAYTESNDPDINIPITSFMIRNLKSKLNPYSAMNMILCNDNLVEWL